MAKLILGSKMRVISTKKESRICAECGETILGESSEIASDVHLCMDCSGVKMCDCCGHVDEIDGDECPLCGGEML